MATYVSIFTTAAIITIIFFGMEFVELDHRNPKDGTFYRFQIANAYFSVLIALLFLGLHLLMLHMIVKYDRRLSPELKAKIMKNLQQAFADGD